MELKAYASAMQRKKPIRWWQWPFLILGALMGISIIGARPQDNTDA